MSTFFHNLKESMIETCDQMIRVVEEATSILMGFASQENDESEQQSPTGGSDDLIHDILFDEDEGIDDMKSPLDGITEGVLGDIMKNQVSSISHVVVSRVTLLMILWYFIFVFISSF